MATITFNNKEYEVENLSEDTKKFLASLQLNRYRNLKAGRPRIEDKQIILTL